MQSTEFAAYMKSTGLYSRLIYLFTYLLTYMSLLI